ncbi:WbqC family protein, partial [bacterium]|nr:WbqC family protein [candidate division CSSED10-310 bacterium]
YLDTAAFTKNGFQNRNRIRLSNKIDWLTVPILSKGFYNHPTKEIRINNQVDWKRKHLLTFRHNYGKYPYYSYVYDFLLNIYAREYHYLVSLNLALLTEIRKMLGISNKTFLASELNEHGTGTERLISLIKSVGGKSYISGQGAKKYLNDDLFRKERITLIYQVFSPECISPATKGSEVPLSILDVMFTLGPKTIDWLIGGTP